ncbi:MULTISPECIES: hypothetical protein [unclassified Spirulina]|uniref:hypothetical protein n=1 Tax=unclassified Spirulina TaxID=2684457 RepID=UPI00194ED6D6|nr:MULTISPECIES: hypothetical protein [Spirulina]MEA5468499.1 hypothetical protein [Spirulina sp. 06S082]
MDENRLTLRYIGFIEPVIISVIRDEKPKTRELRRYYLYNKKMEQKSIGGGECVF